MRALILSCTLKASAGTSNTEALADVLIGQLRSVDVECEMMRLVDLEIADKTAATDPRYMLPACSRLRGTEVKLRRFSDLGIEGGGA